MSCVLGIPEGQLLPHPSRGAPGSVWTEPGWQLRGHAPGQRPDMEWGEGIILTFQMIVNHFFVDGAGHICLAWGVCQPREVAALIGNKQPRPWDTFKCPVLNFNLFLFCVRFTCPECVEGMEMVGAYMNDPLWIAEYTVYLEQNFCVGHNDHHCIQMVRGPTDSWPYLTILRSRCISPPCTPWPWRSSSSLRTFATSTSLPVVAPSPPCKQLFIFKRRIYVLKLKDKYLQKENF